MVVALDRDGAIAAVDDLVASGIDALAVCLLWSFVNSDHERQIAEHVRAAHSGLYLSLSSEVAPLLGEYERSVSTVFNSYIGPTVGDYLHRLETQLKAQGMSCSLLVMQSNGGLSTVPAIRNRPLLTIDSGPAGGVLGGHYFSEFTDARNIICADVGGTTFDVGLVFDDRVQMDPLPVIDQYAYLTPKIYIKSIGAGGGSIAWVDNGGSLRVGPHSAGAMPGPACYGRGGTEPTVTDAHVVLGYLDAKHPLGGTVHLDRDAADAALATVAERLSMSVVDFGRRHRRNLCGTNGRPDAQSDGRTRPRPARLHRFCLWRRRPGLRDVSGPADWRAHGLCAQRFRHVFRARDADHMI